MSWILLKQKKKLNRIINLIGIDEILNRVQRSGIGAGIPEKNPPHYYQAVDLDGNLRRTNT
jgi:hypothetical protein